MGSSTEKRGHVAVKNKSSNLCGITVHLFAIRCGLKQLLLRTRSGETSEQPLNGGQRTGGRGEGRLGLNQLADKFN